MATVVVRADSTTRVSAFQDGGPSTLITFQADSARFLGVNPLTRNLVLISIVTDAAATAPSEIQPLFANYTRTTAGTSTSPLRFGNYHPRADSVYVFGISGRGFASVFNDEILIIEDSSLARPPEGYYYAASLIRRDSANVVRDTILLGAQTAPFPRRNVSLRDADISLVDPVVQASPPIIVAASNRIDADTISALNAAGNRPFLGVANVLITLESKFGFEAIVSPSVILSATVPNSIRFCGQPGGCD